MSTSLPMVLLSAIAGLAVGSTATILLTPSTSSAVIPSRRQEEEERNGTQANKEVAVIERLGTTAGELRMVDGTVIRGGTIGPVVDYLQRLAYVTAYDRKNRIPAWAAEHLTAANLTKPPPMEGTNGGGDRSNSTFKEDASIPLMFRAKLVDYFRSGYDRGHMVPAADAKKSQDAMDQTFLLSNIAPQVGNGFNRHYWAYLEAFCRNLTSSFEDVYVFTVPLFLPKKDADGKFRVTYEVLTPQTGSPTIAVPTHFAKVIIASRPPKSSNSPSNTTLSLYGSNPTGLQKEWSIGAFVLPNATISDETRLETFLVPVEAVESSAGLTLLPDSLKAVARPLCSTVSCQLIVRKFDDAQKSIGKKNNGGGGGKNGRERSATN